MLRDIVGLCREKGWVLDLQKDVLDGHAFDEGTSQTGKTPIGASQAWDTQVKNVKGSLSPSSSKKRKALGDITISTHHQKARMRGTKVPNKIFLAGKRGVLDGKPVLRNIYEEAL